MSSLLRALLVLFIAVAAAGLAARFFLLPPPSPPAPEKAEPETPATPLEPPPTEPEQTPPPESKSSPPPPPPPARIEAPPVPSPLPAALSVEPVLTDQEFYNRYAPAVVQILCQTPQELFSASGVIVNDRGLIMTNAHVAGVVKKVGEANCQARSGNPALAFAGLRIVFAADTTREVPETKVPQGDIAFLELVDPREPFAAATVAIRFIERGANLLTLGYPSEFLKSITATANSNLVFSTLRIDGYVDLNGDLSTAEAYVSRGGIALQQGSSGTALFERAGRVVGLIFATTKGETTAEREGIALSTPYIDAVLRLETGQGLAEFIASH